MVLLCRAVAAPTGSSPRLLLLLLLLLCWRCCQRLRVLGEAERFAVGMGVLRGNRARGLASSPRLPVGEDDFYAGHDDLVATAAAAAAVVVVRRRRGAGADAVAGQHGREPVARARGCGGRLRRGYEVVLLRGVVVTVARQDGGLGWGWSALGRGTERRGGGSCCRTAWAGVDVQVRRGVDRVYRRPLDLHRVREQGLLLGSGHRKTGCSTPGYVPGYVAH